jgi:hypothetical protein
MFSVTAVIPVECTPVKADSHIPYRSAKGLDCVFPIWFTQCGSVWFTHTMPFPCHATNMPFWKTSQGHDRVTAWEQHGMCELRVASTVRRRHVGGLQEFGVFLLPCGVPGSLLSESYQSQMQVASVKQSNVCQGRGEAYYFGARTCVLV